jgi:ABC-type nickel/cobalt efflux system permease component RcnA
MTTRFARFLLLFAALWLPVQTMAALSMPLCRHAQEQAAASLAAQPEAMPCHEAATQDQVPNHDAGCDNCELCHIASTGFMPSAALTADPVQAEYHYAMPAVAAPPSHIAEPPQHPPRAIA